LIGTFTPPPTAAEKRFALLRPVIFGSRLARPALTMMYGVALRLALMGI
jgi:hypothetical protein